MRNRAFVSQVVPQNEVGKLRVSQAANNFCYSLIDACCFDCCISILPNRISRKGLKIRDGKVCFANYQPKTKLGDNIIARLSADTIIALKRLAKYHDIWFYNLTTSTLLLFLCLKYFFRRKVYVILADFSPEEQSVINKFIYWCINSSNGIITLSSRVKLPIKKQYCIPGVVDKRKCSSINNNRLGHRIFLFAVGNATVEKHMMKYKAFSMVPEAEFWITGLRSKKEYNAILSKYDNIKYWEFLSYEEYIEKLKDVDVVLSLRNGEETANLYNFPSKVLEAFAYGKAVLSTMNYTELRAFKYFVSDFNVEDLSDNIKKINEMPENEFCLYLDNYEALEKCVSVQVWKDKMSFLELSK